MDDIERLHGFLYVAFLDIRAASRSSGDTVSYHLADLLHVLPLQLAQATRGECNYSELLDSLRTRAREQGIERWVDDRIRQLEENGSRSS
jgi:hypothetical protein